MARTLDPVIDAIGLVFPSARQRQDTGAATATGGGADAGIAVTPTRLAPLLTLITEVPDETVSGAAWHRCVRAHVAVNEAVTRGLLAWLEATGGRR